MDQVIYCECDVDYGSIERDLAEFCRNCGLELKSTRVIDNTEQVEDIQYGS